MLGYKENEIGNVPMNGSMRLHPEDQKKVPGRTCFTYPKDLLPQFECEYRIQQSTGKLFVGAQSWLGSAANVKGIPYRMAGSQSDITPRKLAVERLAYDALHDALTGLPNRALFMELA